MASTTSQDGTDRYTGQSSAGSNSSGVRKVRRATSVVHESAASKLLALGYEFSPYLEEHLPRDVGRLPVCILYAPLRSACNEA